MHKIEFPTIPPEILFDRDAICFTAHVNRKPVKCVVIFAAILGAGNNDAFDALAEFTQRKADFQKIARAMIVKGGVKNGELLIQCKLSC